MAAKSSLPNNRWRNKHTFKFEKKMEKRNYSANISVRIAHSNPEYGNS